MAAKVAKMPVDLDMSRRTDLKGQTVNNGNFTITYDKNGYATQATNNSNKPIWETIEEADGSNDSRIAAVGDAQANAMSKVSSTYGNMINNVDGFYQKQIDAVGDYADKQAQIQQERTDFAIEQIEQQKDQAKQDYTKEQSGAYVDWQKQSGEYGANAEQMAAQGMGGTGYSESAQVSMYNQYQRRVATARETFNRAILNYDNAIKDARLQNNAALAEIAYNALQTQLELSLEGFQYKNNLIQEKTKMELEVDNQYWNRYTDVLDQINNEKALAEEIRQFNEKMAEEKRQYNESMAPEKAQLAEQKRQFNAKQAAEEKDVYTSPKSGGGGSGSGSGGTRKSKGETNRGSGVKEKKTYLSKGETNRNSGKTASNPTVDMQSVLALGYGPISASRLNELEEQGLIQSYKSGNKIKFKKSPFTNKQLMINRQSTLFK